MNLLYSSRKKSFSHLLQPFHSALKKSAFTSRNFAASTSRIFYDNNKLSSELQSLLTEDSKFLEVLEEAQQRFYPKYMEIRKQRPLTHEALRNQIENGFLDYRSDTKWIRESSWQAATIPDVLAKRPVFPLLDLSFLRSDLFLFCSAFFSFLCSFLCLSSYSLSSFFSYPALLFVSSRITFRLNSLGQRMICR
jgi:hypothetical protein